MNPFAYSLGNDCIEICKYLLDNGYDVNRGDDFCDPPLIHVTHNCNIKYLELVLRYNPIIDIRSKKVYTNS
jgi:hypothetical protein